MKEIDADIEILIGMNVPKAMKPGHIISQGNGPNAAKTLLGWGVNGPLNFCSVMEESGPVSVTFNRISKENLRDLLIRQHTQDLPVKEH